LIIDFRIGCTVGWLEIDASSSATAGKGELIISGPQGQRCVSGSAVEKIRTFLQDQDPELEGYEDKIYVRNLNFHVLKVQCFGSGSMWIRMKWLPWIWIQDSQNGVQKGKQF